MLGKKSSDLVADDLQKFEKYLHVDKLDRSQNAKELQSVLNDSDKKVHTDSELKDTISKIFLSQPNCFHQFPEPAFSSASSSRSSSFRSQKNKTHTTVLENDAKTLKSDSSFYTTNKHQSDSGIGTSAMHVMNFESQIFSSLKFVSKTSSTTSNSPISSNQNTSLFDAQNNLISLNMEVSMPIASSLSISAPSNLKSKLHDSSKINTLCLLTLQDLISCFLI